MSLTRRIGRVVATVLILAVGVAAFALFVLLIFIATPDARPYP